MIRTMITVNLEWFMADMNFNDYQSFTQSAAKYEAAVEEYVATLQIPDEVKAKALSHLLKVTYVTLGMVGEAGELANKLKKVLRDDKGEISGTKKLDMVDENGDVTWYNSELFRQFGVNFATGAKLNVDKITSRMDRGVQGGSGDKR